MTFFHERRRAKFDSPTFTIGGKQALVDAGTTAVMSQTGIVTVASGAATGTATFGTAFGSGTPKVFPQLVTAVGDVAQVQISSVSTTTFNISQASNATANATYDYIAYGNV